MLEALDGGALLVAELLVSRYGGAVTLENPSLRVRVGLLYGQLNARFKFI